MTTNQHLTLVIDRAERAEGQALRDLERAKMAVQRAREVVVRAREARRDHVARTAPEDLALLEN